MDAHHFDALTRAIDLRAPRRVALGGVLGGGIFALTAYFGIDGADAKRKKKKKKKKCKRPRVKCGKKCCASGQFCAGGQCAAPCVLEDAGTILRLQGNCATTTTIEIPDGVDFDGNDKTIWLIGSPDGFDGNGVFGGNATVNNLTIDGGGLSGPCDPFLFPVSLLGWAGGRIENVSVNNNRCGSGVAGAAPNEIVMVSASGIRSETSSVQLAAIGVGGANASNGTVAGCLIRDSDIGISLVDLGSLGVNGTIPDNDIRNVIIGIDVAGAAATAAITNAFIEDAQVGIHVHFNATAAITDSTIDGPGSGVADSAGISFENGGGGSATSNTISNFLCGIFEAADAGTVAQSGNTFSGNGDDTCIET